MKAKKILALVLTLCMVVSLFPVAFAAEEADALSFADAELSYINCKLDGKDIKVAMYEDLYLANTTHEDQKVAVYVPENATADSPIMLMVNNSGWQSNSYSGRNGVKNYGIEQGFHGEELVGDYKSDSNTDAVGRAIAEGYVIVGYGCRSRNNGQSEDGNYYGHSPATMSDTKAVIRYLRYNADLLPAGDPEKIVVTGTSGGGALSVVIAASGDSEDYYPSLFESGAAGIVKKSDGSYSSTISDAVWATIAYCPITDLGHACAAYEWTWADARNALIADGVEVAGRKGPENYATVYGMGEEKMAAATELLTANYIEYIDSLGLESVNSKNLKATIIEMIEAEIAESIEEFGAEQMKADLKGADWLVINDDGTFEYDYEKHVYWVGTQSVFKAPSAFSNVGMTAWKGNMNEDNLFGTTADEYSPFNEYSWNNDDTTNAVGADDTGLTWDEYMATEEGEYLALQAKMTNGIAYLLDGEGESKSAPNWYVRYGMADRDSSFAVEAVLNAAMEADKTIENKSFEFAWLKPHSGNYDVNEAYAWLADKLDPHTFKDAKATELTPKLDGKDIKVTMYEDLYLANTTHPDQKVAVYVPENATDDSPIVLYVNNGGWQGNSYSGRKGVDNYGWVEETKRGETVTVLKGDYKSTGNDEVGRMLSEGYVIVAYGCRSRNNGQSADGTYNGHSPATMSDTKAVIRYLRYNDALIPAGDADKIIVTGTSGGGALSTVIAASGNSSDFYPSLYESGAYGIDYVDGKYVDNGSDAVMAVIAYCPITDLGHACAAYEWQYNATREAMYESGHMDYKTLDEKTNMAASAELKAVYEEYIDGLGVEAVNSKNLKATIIELMETEIAEAIDEIGVEQMKKDLAATEYAGTWITFNEDGSFDYDYDEHLYWLARKQTLKPASAFSNVGMAAWAGNMNEDNLFGGTDDVYSPFNPYSWNNDTEENDVGKDDTGLTWDGFMATEEGKALALQTRMTSAVDYLYDKTDDTDVAPYWYVRHGMADRDTAFAVETVLFNGIKNEEAILNYNYEFAWLQGHAGNYDVEEAYAWLETIVAPKVQVSTQNVAVAGEKVDPEIYNIEGYNYFKLRDIAVLLKGTEAEFAVDFDNAKKEVYIDTDGKYVADGKELNKAGDKSDSLVLSDFTIIIDGEEVAVQVYNIGGNNYFKLADLGDALGFAYSYDVATRTVNIL